MRAPEFPFLDIDRTPRFIDFTRRAAQRRIALQADGATHYLPADCHRTKCGDDLLRRNARVSDSVCSPRR